MYRVFFVAVLLTLTINLKAQFNDNFESGTIGTWLQTPDQHWAASSTSPITEAFSLKQTFNSSASGEDRISHAMPSMNVNSGTVTWRFKIKYNYDPTSSNHWVVFLMANKPSTDMFSGGAINGYMLGVDFNTSDDSLRLWKCTNGVAQSVVVKTKINWMKTNGLNKPAGFEVTRSSTGNWEVKMDSTGGFDKLVSRGTGSDATYTDASYFGIDYKYTSSADMLLWVDDISINFVNQNQHDLTSQILPPSTQIPAKKIIVSSVNAIKPIDLFRFEIQDFGTTDGLPTIVNQITIKPTTANNTDWSTIIKDVQIKQNANIISTSSPTISNQKIIIPINSQNLKIADNSMSEITLSVYLNSTEIIDGNVLQCKIDSSSHEFKTDTTGSGFVATLSGNIVSPPITLDVIASKMIFDSLPTQIMLNTPFAVQTALVDSFGNVDKDVSNQIQIATVLGDGILSSTSGLTQTPINGIVNWTDLIYNKFGQIRLQCSATNFANISTDTIIVSGNNDSKIVTPDIQIPAKTISSISCSTGDAVEVMKFKIKDSGNGDKLATTVTQIKIKNPTPTNNAQWTKNIQGVRLKSGNKFLALGVVQIKDTYIIIPIKPDECIIADSSAIELTLLVYLRTSSIDDGKCLQFVIDNVDHGCIADAQGSVFATTFDAKITSSIFTIDVVATKLNISNVPSILEINSGFQATVTACDANNNIDKQATNIINISRGVGTGVVCSSILNVPLTNGTCTFVNLQYNTIENFTLFAQSDGLSSAESSAITATGNKSSAVVPPNQQIATTTISSLIDAPSVAQNVFKFVVVDKGSGDGKPTTVNQIKIQNAFPDNSATWTKNIAGCILFDGLTPIELTSVVITDNDIAITPNINAIIVNDGAQKELTLAIYLKKFTLADGATLQFMINASNNGWTAQIDGSQFASDFGYDIFSSTFTIDVKATQLKFINLPAFITKNEPFGFAAIACDRNNNRDIHNSSTLQLSKNTGFGNVTFNSSVQQLDSGQTVWKQISYDSVSYLTLKLDDTKHQLQTVVSDSIYCAQTIETKVSEDFENGTLTGWFNTSDWTCSMLNPIDGNRSLKHNLTGVDGNSYIYKPTGINDLANGNVLWKFSMRNGNFDPSSTSWFWFVLAADTSNLLSNQLNAYVVGVDISGTSDTLMLVRLANGKFDKMILKADFDWNENTFAGIEILRKSNGEWNMKYNTSNDSTKMQSAGKSFDNLFQNLPYCGLVFQYTSTRAGQLWFDDLKIETANTPPSVKSVSVLSDSIIAVTFNEMVNNTTAENSSNYVLKNSLNQNITILQAKIDSSQKVITLNIDNLKTGQYQLNISNISDLQHMKMNSFDNSFTFLSELQAGDIVINEIMADPTPVVGLPNYEFLELYNRSDHDVNLKNWILSFGATDKTLTDCFIKKDSFLILTSTSGVAPLQKYGKVLGITSFPGLLNAGVKLVLKNPTKQIISQVNYTSDWYADTQKKSGGWSLERIDPANNCSGKENWRASINLSGGTPGKKNSVYAINVDNVPPEIIYASAQNNQTLKLVFTENVSPTSGNVLNNYFVDASIGNPASIYIDSTATGIVYLTFEPPFISGQTYNLTIQNVTDVCGNKILTKTIPFIYYKVKPYDVVINEIMANPSPSNGLPESEYIEIYNTTHYTIDLKDWKIFIGAYSNSFPSFLLTSKQYLILCDTSAQMQFQKYGLTLGLPGFHTLTNSGQILQLLNQQNEIISAINYSDKWFTESFKQAGGWSLEQIDPDNHSGVAQNWKASTNKAGGTPGQVNSVLAINTDNLSPLLRSIGLKTNNTISLYFNEAMDSVSLMNLSNYSVDNKIGNPVFVNPVAPFYSQVDISFATSFAVNKNYVLTVKKIITDASGNGFDADVNFKFTVPEIADSLDLVVNEVLFSPYTGGYDFVEIYNRSTKVIDLQNYFIATRDAVYLQLTGYQPLQSSSFLLQPNQYAVVTEDAENIIKTYRTSHPEMILEIPILPSYNSDKGSVVLVDKNRNVIDDFRYDQSMHFQLLKDFHGVSLERLDENRQTNDRTNWHSAAESAGFATPADRNSQVNVVEKTDAELSVSPEIFSPDNDGHDDVTNLSYQFDKSGYVANVTIYDSKGRLIKRLVKNEMLSNQGVFSWDGLTEQNTKAAIGIYIFYVEVFDLLGNVKSYKKTCVIASKLN